MVSYRYQLLFLSIILIIIKKVIAVINIINIASIIAIIKQIKEKTTEFVILLVNIALAAKMIKEKKIINYFEDLLGEFVNFMKIAFTIK